MPKKKAQKKYDFTPVAMFFIVLGTIFFVVGLCMIFFVSKHLVPSGFSWLITIGGVMVMIGGYTNLELGLIRKQLEKKK